MHPPGVLSAGVTVALVGLPGSGKSTLGQLLARHLGWPFADADRLVEAQAGATIEALFARGPEVFRRAEQQVLAGLLAGPNALRPGVLATGGGAVLLPANRRLLRQHSRVVHLQADVDLLLQRLKPAAHGRPLLAGGDVRAALEALSRERQNLYAEVAHLSLPVRNEPAEASLQRLLQLLDA